MKVIVSETCDGFTLPIETSTRTKSFWFNQEDDKSKLVEVFEDLGIEAEYEEDY